MADGIVKKGELFVRIEETNIPGVLIIHPDLFGDSRGYFLETWNQQRYAEVGLNINFVQDNLSYSQQGVLRGLHFQNPDAQGKLVYVIDGEVFDVAIDIRVGSPTFGEWVGNILSGRNKRQVYIPEGFAHGFCVLSETALFTYKCTDVYSPSNENGILWNDPDLAITWPLAKPILSNKDKQYSRLRDIDTKKLPSYGGGPNELRNLA